MLAHSLYSHQVCQRANVERLSHKNDNVLARFGEREFYQMPFNKIDHVLVVFHFVTDEDWSYSPVHLD